MSMFGRVLGRGAVFIHMRAQAAEAAAVLLPQVLASNAALEAAAAHGASEFLLILLCAVCVMTREKQC